MGREHETAALAAEQAERDVPVISWEEEVAAARAKLPPGADFAAMVREGMAAVAHEREGPSAETAAAFGKWLEADPDAALDFMGRASRFELVSRLQGELERWLGSQGNHRRLGELVRRFPMAREELLECATMLGQRHGVEFLLEMARTLDSSADRMEILIYHDSAAQWQGHLAQAAAALDPRDARAFLCQLDGEKVADLLDEVRSAGFTVEGVAAFEQGMADRQDRASRLGEYRPPRKELPARKALEEQVRAAAQRHPNSGGPPQDLSQVMPGFDDAVADLRDGRLTVAQVLSQVQAAWPTAESPAVANDMRVLLYRIACDVDPLTALQEASSAGWDFDVRGQTVENVALLSAYQLARLAEARPEWFAAGGDPDLAHLCGIRFRNWHGEAPQACEEALQRFPNEALRAQMLEEFSKEEEEGGGE